MKISMHMNKLRFVLYILN